MTPFKSAAAVIALLTAGTADAAAIIPSHIYEFSGSAADANGGPAMTLGSGASFVGMGATGGLRFADNQGPTIANAFANPFVYSLDMFFSLDVVHRFRRLIDFANGSRDEGLYLEDGDLRFYGHSVNADTNVQPGQMAHLAVTRDAAHRVRVYLNGVERFSANDAANGLAAFSKPGGVARFFRDDNAESSPGFVDFIRLYDRALDASEVASLHNDGTPLREFQAPVSAVPEPATWATMLAGFFLTGGALRRRRRAQPELA